MEVERRGIWAPSTIKSFDTVTSKWNRASDHAAVYVGPGPVNAAVPGPFAEEPGTGVHPKSDQQPIRRAARYPSIWSRDTRSCFIVSRSRTVTALSSSVSKSTVTQNGVPISSWRR